MSRPFAALAMPFHEAFRTERPLMLATGVAAAPAIIALASWSLSRKSVHIRRTLALVGWILVSVAPVFTLFFVSADLQNSRYIYLGAAAWSVLLATCASEIDDLPRRILGLSAIAGLMVVFAIAQHRQLQLWEQAASRRDSVFAAVIHAPVDRRAAGVPGDDGVDGQPH